MRFYILWREFQVSACLWMIVAKTTDVNRWKTSVISVAGIKGG